MSTDTPTTPAAPKRSKKAGDPSKPLSLQTFVHLVGPRALKAGTDAEKRILLKQFGEAYRSSMANPVTTCDFPATNTKQAWLDAYDAWLRIVLVAHAIERQEATAPAEPVSTVN